MRFVQQGEISAITTGNVSACTPNLDMDALRTLAAILHLGSLARRACH